MNAGGPAEWPRPAWAGDAADAELARRERVLVHSAAALLCCVPVYLTFLLIMGAGWSIPTVAVVCSGIAVLPVFFLARRRRHLTLLGNFVVAILWAVLWLVGTHDGGIQSATMYWLPVLPLVALLLAGWRWAALWCLVAVVHGGYLHALAAAGVDLPHDLPEEAGPAFSAFGQGTLALVLLALGLVYETARRAARVREREHAETLAASEAAFRAVIEQLPDALIVHQHGRILYANPAMIELFAYEDAQQLVGRRVAEILHPEDRDASRGHRDGTAAGTTSVVTREQRLVRPDGSTFVAEVTVVPITLAGEPATVAFGRDVTARKQLSARLMEVDRMAAVGTLAAGVAHEINNPLAYVQANIEFALRQLGEGSPDEHGALAAGAGGSTRVHAGGAGAAGGPAPDTVVEVLEEAAEGTRRIAQVVTDLMTFSRVEEHEAGPVDPAAVIVSAAAMAHNQIRHRARLRLETASAPLVEANEAHLGQVMLNLLVNAAQAIEEGDAGANEIAVQTRLDEGWVTISVTDTGRGIPDSELERIFDPFFTTKPQGQGTGLGLSISRRLVESMGGHIEVESEVGRGSTFRVVLRQATQPVVEAPVKRASPQPPRTTPRVLVVDDDELVGRSVVRTLRGRAEVDLAGSGTEALQRLEQGVRYDIVLCDLMMPQMTGMDLYEELRERYPELAERTVFVTGGAFTPRAEQFLGGTSRPVIGKPFDPTELRRLVSELSGP